MRLTGNLPQGGTAGNDLILARAYGRTLRRFGGVPYGTSGSPVYRGRTLLGAISTVFTPDNFLVGITPLQAMLALTQEPTPSMASLGPKHLAGRLPLTAQGISSHQVLSALQQHYGHVQETAMAPAPDNQSKGQLRPGDAIGAALMLGDIQLGYIGTVTLVQGKQVFAFGHPLLFTGPTNIPLTRVFVVTTTRGQYPQKIGGFGPVIGTVRQDRSAGVLAELDLAPFTVAMKFTVEDRDRQKRITVLTQAANISSELPFLAFIAALESMQRAMNRVGAGNAAWQWRLTLTEATEPIEATASEQDPNNIGFLVAMSGESLVSQVLATGATLKSIELVATVGGQ